MRKALVYLVIIFSISIHARGQIPEEARISTLPENAKSFLQLNIGSDQKVSILQDNAGDKQVSMDLDFRPRAELRNGYQQLPNDTTRASFFINQRVRLGLNYQVEKHFGFRFSIQDLRVWGQQDPRSTTPSTLQVFEAWVEPYLYKNFSIRIGRQKLSFDNQRLFAENDWRISGCTHDAINFRYYDTNISSELALAFNQSSEQIFGTNYSPDGFTNYKFLAVDYFRYRPADKFILSAINASDGYQQKNNTGKINYRFTNGGRIEFENKSFYMTFSGYYQWGKDPSGKSLSAWYMQPEIRYAIPAGITFRAGTEVFSGNSTGSTITTDHSFVPLYGTNHRFNGSLDLITKFPTDIGNAGLVNPYLSIMQNFGKNIELRGDFHSFHSYGTYVKDGTSYKKFLGIENDWTITYKPDNTTKLEGGISYARMSESFEVIKNAGHGSHNKTPLWFYFQVSFKPRLFSVSFN